MDAEEYFRREAAGLLAEFPDLTHEEIAAQVREERYDGDPAVAAVVLSLGRRLRVTPSADPGPLCLGDVDEAII